MSHKRVKVSLICQSSIHNGMGCGVIDYENIDKIPKKIECPNCKKKLKFKYLRAIYKE